MTEKRYLPEGGLIGTRENTASTATAEALARAMVQEQILEGIVTVCDCTSMRLTVNLGEAIGIMEREDALLTADGTPPKDIAIITRVGKPICFKIIGIDQSGARPVVRLSRRAAQAECMREYILTRRPGDIIPAQVTHLEPFGAFVDIGCGIVSLLSVDCISVSRIAHPSDRFSPGDAIMAVVKSIDPETGRVYMTHRELLGTWEENAAMFAPTQTVPGIIRSIEPYGIFVELAPNLAGLAEVRDDVAVGDRCAVYIKSILPERMKIKLVIIDSHAQLSGAPMRYFADTAAGHMPYWRYSPPGCRKLIETRFDEAAVPCI